MLLPKHHAEEGRVRIYEGYFYLQVSPALLKELRLAMARRTKQVAPAGRRSTTSVSVARASQQLAGKRKANEVASSGDSMEPAKRRPVSGAGSMPLPANSTITGEQAAAVSRQPGQSGGGATFWPGPSPHLSQVGRSSPQPWIRTHPNPMSQWRQPTGAYLATCAGM